MKHDFSILPEHQFTYRNKMHIMQRYNVYFYSSTLYDEPSTFYNMVPFRIICAIVGNVCCVQHYRKKIFANSLNL